ncbi:uncharacterized protein [Halyomorpha halys]|uniref:uncharacterized protein n=1 Tax=Halyomorpha halys TaxID=286706 RepID=UPI0034D2A455
MSDLEESESECSLPEGDITLDILPDLKDRIQFILTGSSSDTETEDTDFIDFGDENDEILDQLLKRIPSLTKTGESAIPDDLKLEDVSYSDSEESFPSFGTDDSKKKDEFYRKQEKLEEVIEKKIPDTVPEIEKVQDEFLKRFSPKSWLPDMREDVSLEDAFHFDDEDVDEGEMPLSEEEIEIEPEVELNLLQMPRIKLTLDEVIQKYV